MSQGARTKGREAPETRRRPSSSKMQERIDALAAELAEARAQQIATAEVLQVINASPGDLGPVFDAILEKALLLCEANFGNMFLYDGGKDRSVAVRGAPELADWMADRGAVPPAPGSLGDRLMREEDIVHIIDAADEAAYESSPTRRAVVEIGGFHTLLAVALRQGDMALGGIVVYRKEVRPFTDKQIALLQNFAAQAVVAIENARLLGELRRRTSDLEESLEYQTATSNVLQVMSRSTSNLQPVLQTLVETAARICAADQGVIFRRDDDGYRAAATIGIPPEYNALLLGARRELGRGTLLGRVVLSGRPVHVADLATDPEYASPQAVSMGMARTGLGVPLLREGEPIGVINLVRRRVEPFTERQIELVRNFADQAVIAMENARLITETREALEQQTATAEVLQVINSSPGDLGPVFDAILDKGLYLCEAAFGTLWTFDGECFHAVALHRVPAGFAEVLTHAPYHPEPGSGHERLLRGASYFQIHDARAEASIGPVRRALVELGGARTVIAVPLRKESTILGAISAYRQEVRPFSDKQIALLENFAAQAVIAMDNARLITETREALEQQTATAEVLGVINSSPGDLGPVFDAMLEKAMRLCEAAFGYLMTYDGERFQAVAHRGLPARFAEYLPRMDQPGSAGAYARINAGAPLVHIIDLKEGEVYESSPLRRALVDLGGARAGLIVALRKDEALLGVFTIYRQEVRSFSDKESALLQNFAAQAVIAMENARLLTETRERSRDLQESLEYQTATGEVLKAISQSSFDLPPVLATVAETAARLCAADLAFIVRREGDVYRPVASYSLSPEWEAHLWQESFTPSRETVIGRALLEARSVQVADLAADPEHSRPGAVTIGRVRTALSVPLLREREPIGVIAIGRQRVEPFSDKQVELVTTFADQAVIAIENARLLGELRQRTEEVAELNRGLEVRVAEQVDELGRVGRLKRFLAPQLAELIVSQGDEKILESHRREIVVAFCDLRGYTAFTETAEPEEVLDFLREYHGALGPLVGQYEGTLDQFSGDGIMVFFNDPVPIPDPAERAVNMAVAMRETAGSLIAAWRERGRDLGFGVGIAQGYATLGQIGFSERSGYTAIGTVCNVAARLCAEAKDGQILLSQRVSVALKGSVVTEQVGALALKGLTQPVIAYNVPLVATQPALRVIEGGPQSV